MQTSTEAEEHLRVIRSLMERATIYRAISAPSALVGGVLAIVTALGAMEIPGGLVGVPATRINFAGVWLVVLFFSAVANLYFLRRDGDRRDTAFVSPGMRLAIAALLPSFLASAVFTTLWGILGRGDVMLACLWLIFYGLGLLATAHFAPRSMCLLGWAFLVAGLALFIAVSNRSSEFFDYFVSWKTANTIMAVTFGGFHLIYAACTWPRRARSAEAAATP